MKKLSKRNKILGYTEYKREQALWLQIQNKSRTDRGTNTEQFCIKCYLEYLVLIGYNKEKTFNRIRQYLNNIGTYHLATENEMFNKGYNEKIAKNINKLMDKVLK